MPRRCPVEQRERATRKALDRLGEYPSAWAAAQALDPRLGVGAETLRKWIPAGLRYAGYRSDPTSEELEKIRRLRAEVRDLKEANEILKAASSRARLQLREVRRGSCQPRRGRRWPGPPTAIPGDRGTCPNLHRDRRRVRCANGLSASSVSRSRRPPSDHRR
jgi:transposase